MELFKTNTILKTKLQAPYLPGDYITKHKLIEHVNHNIERPLTLVSAGAGFGKSTFMSSWLKQLQYKNGWVSLDENDNDLQTFLTYFITAIQNAVPGFGQKTQTLLSSPNLPPAKLLTNSLINDLNDLTEFFVLVLDDIYQVSNLEIYKLLTALLKFPPQNFHLVLISRSDPPLPLSKLRASNKIKEIRILDLQFTDEETEKFVKNYLDIEKADNIVSLLNKKTEGWATGVRLAILHISYHYKNEKEKEIENYLKNVSFSESYFIEEVLEHLDKTTVEFLLKTSILDKFCPSLTEYILSSSKTKFNNREIIKRLIKENLFIINLDEENNWFRYHHLFQSFLRKELTNRYSADIVNKLNKKALEWYKQKSFINDALFHATQINDLEVTAGLIEKHMHKPLNENKWFYLAQWLTKIPDNYIYKNPVLLIAQMWIYQHKNMIWLIPELLKNLEEIKKNRVLEPEIDLQMQFFQGVVLFWAAKIEESLSLFDYVRKNLSKDKIGAISLASIYYASAAQMNGTGTEVYLEFEKIIYGKNINPTYKSILFGSLLYMKLQEGDLYTAERLNFQLKEYSSSVNDFFSLTWSNYFLGYVSFQQNKPELAYNYFKDALKNIYFLNMTAPVDNFAGMLLTLKILNNKKEYDKIYSQLLSFINERNNPAFSTIAYSLRARLALIENDITSAIELMKMADMFFDSGNTQFFIESPRLTYCRILLAQENKNKTEEAIKKLEEHLELAVKTDNVFQIIRINIMRAVAFIRTNNRGKAIKSLLLALKKAQPGNWIMPFIEDGGEEIRVLLPELANNKKAGKFVSMLLDEFSAITDTDKKKSDMPAKKSISSSGYYQLTNRELDIINLLAKRLSNKEIANELFISETTVKRHAINIYQKLGVNKRRDAVLKVQELGLLM
jgi:LuxR family maltose regulon positive regulatory protein